MYSKLKFTPFIRMQQYANIQISKSNLKRHIMRFLSNSAPYKSSTVSFVFILLLPYEYN